MSFKNPNVNRQSSPFTKTMKLLDEQARVFEELKASRDEHNTTGSSFKFSFKKPTVLLSNVREEPSGDLEIHHH